MRITGGIYKGRKLFSPEGMGTRPTSDRVREALFNILKHRNWGEKIGNPLNGKYVLDGFAGTGALGLESLSHGAKHVLLIEQSSKTLKTINQNIALLKCEKTTTTLKSDITKLKINGIINPWSLIFLDPPYNKNLVPPAIDALEKNNLIDKNALIIIETAKKEKLEIKESYDLLLSKTYGDTAIHFYTICHL